MAKRGKGKGGGDYEVGYGKPPKAFQFPPGVSGNPRGGGSRKKTTSEIFQKVLSKPVYISENGERKKVSTEEGLFLQLRGAALGGDRHARREFLSLLERHAPERMARVLELLEEDERILRDRDRSRNGAKPEGDGGEGDD